MQSNYGNAVVIGGSMAGLLAARVLADHFQTVTIIERDTRPAQPEPRRGVPQGRHAHALLLRGLQIVDKLFPDVRSALLQSGAVTLNMGRDMRWFHFGVWKCRYESTLHGISASRPLIEWTVGEHLRRIPNVTMRDGCSVEGMLYADGSVHGVRIRPRGSQAGEEIQADLVVDVSGRGSQTPQQLQTFGYKRPAETAVKIDVCYATRIYRAPASARDWKGLFVISQPPSKRAALILPIEDNRWIVTEVGSHGDHPPTDEHRFLEFAKSLPVPDMYEALRDAEPLSEIVRYGFAAALRRRYEYMRSFPEGLLVQGDALCSFNPVYGQGMSAAAMYADALAQCLKERAEAGRPLTGMWKDFFPLVARCADMPWQLATGEDFRHAETIGPRSPALRLMHWYTGKAQVACGHDAYIGQRMQEIMHLLKPPTTIFKPDILLRLLAGRSEPMRDHTPAGQAYALPGPPP